jgi:hypothetical protein
MRNALVRRIRRTDRKLSQRLRSRPFEDDSNRPGRIRTGDRREQEARGEPHQRRCRRPHSNLRQSLNRGEQRRAVIAPMTGLTMLKKTATGKDGSPATKRVFPIEFGLGRTLILSKCQTGYRSQRRISACLASISTPARRRRIAVTDWRSVRPFSWKSEEPIRPGRGSTDAQRPGQSGSLHLHLGPGRSFTFVVARKAPDAGHHGRSLVEHACSSSGDMSVMRERLAELLGLPLAAPAAA